MLKTTLLIVPILTLQLFNAVNDFNKDLPQSVQMGEDVRLVQSREAFKIIKAPSDRIETLSKGTFAATVATEIDPVLIATLMSTESEFKVTALSPLGYKSLMQRPRSRMKWEYAEVDVVDGACCLREKLKIAKGDMLKALTFYKGSDSLYVKNRKTGRLEKSAGHKQAEEVLDLYNRVKETLRQQA